MNTAPRRPPMRRLTAALLLLIPLAAACDSPTSSSKRNGELTGTLNGAPWNGDAHSAMYRDTLYINSGDTGGSTERHILVAVVPNAAGGYSVVPGLNSPPGSRYEELLGGDVVTYRASATSGSVTFTEYTATRTRGSLQLTFSGPRGTWQFSGQFDAPRKDID